MNVETTARDWNTLIHRHEVHGSVYTDPSIYEQELTNIWYRTWVYVGHVSEIPNPNDFVTKSIGPRTVLMTRDRHGTIPPKSEFTLLDN
jgi:phenylpropionate dioxygenase-like ring-hydroxylating dioxygenase large terminal subunit